MQRGIGIPQQCLAQVETVVTEIAGWAVVRNNVIGIRRNVHGIREVGLLPAGTGLSGKRNGCQQLSCRGPQVSDVGVGVRRTLIGTRIPTMLPSVSEWNLMPNSPGVV